MLQAAYVRLIEETHLKFAICHYLLFFERIVIAYYIFLYFIEK